MAKGNSLLLLGLLGAGVAAFALSSKASATPTPAPAPAATPCPLDPTIPPALAQSVNSLLAAVPGSLPSSAYTNLASQVQIAGYPMAAACLLKKAAAAPVSPVVDPGYVGGASPFPTQPIFNIPHILGGAPLVQPLTSAQQDLYNALVAAGNPPSTAMTLAQNPAILSAYQALITGGMPAVQAAQAAAAQNVPHF